MQHVKNNTFDFHLNLMLTDNKVLFKVHFSAGLMLSLWNILKYLIYLDIPNILKYFITRA